MTDAIRPSRPESKSPQNALKRAIDYFSQDRRSMASFWEYNDAACEEIAAGLKLAREALRALLACPCLPHELAALQAKYSDGSLAASETERQDAERYRLWRKHYHTDFAVSIDGEGQSKLVFLPGRPMVEIAGPDYESKVDAALDAAMRASPERERE